MAEGKKERGRQGTSPATLPTPMHILSSLGVMRSVQGGEVWGCTAEGGIRTGDPRILCRIHSGVAISVTTVKVKSDFTLAAIAQLGERQTEDLKVPSSILGVGSIDN